MIELLRTNDIVLISLIDSLFKEDGIEHLVLDQYTSVLEGSIGAIPRRIMVLEEKENVARRLLKDAGLGQYLKSDEKPGHQND
ncbi:MAG: DUF2007 domain-containing protein [Salaquimonas sp.]